MPYSPPPPAARLTGKDLIEQGLIHIPHGLNERALLELAQVFIAKHVLEQAKGGKYPQLSESEQNQLVTSVNIYTRSIFKQSPETLTPAVAPESVFPEKTYIKRGIEPQREFRDSRNSRHGWHTFLEFVSTKPAAMVFVVADVIEHMQTHRNGAYVRADLWRLVYRLEDMAKQIASFPEGVPEGEYSIESELKSLV